jgi:hypothetical protein
VNRLLVVMVALAACGKGADECRTEAEGLGKFLAETPHEPGAFWPHPGITVPERKELKVVAEPNALVVAANAQETIFEGASVADLTDLTARLEAIRREPRWKRMPDRLYFQLDRGTPWSKVVELVMAGRNAQFAVIGFAFASEPLAPPPRTPMDDKIDALKGEAANRAADIARLMVPVVEECPALQKVFGSVASDAGESKADRLIKALAPALIECNCKVDLPALRTLMWRVIAAPPTKVVVVELRDAGKPLAVAATTAWAEVSKQLVHGEPYTFAVK